MLHHNLQVPLLQYSSHSMISKSLLNHYVVLQYLGWKWFSLNTEQLSNYYCRQWRLSLCIIHIKVICRNYLQQHHFYCCKQGKSNSYKKVNLIRFLQMQHFTTSPIPNDTDDTDDADDPRNTNHPVHDYTINLWFRTNSNPKFSHLFLILHSIAIRINWNFGVNHCSKLYVDRNKVSFSSSLRSEMATHSPASTLHEIQGGNKDRPWAIMLSQDLIVSFWIIVCFNLCNPISRLRSLREKTERAKKSIRFLYL